MNDRKSLDLENKIKEQAAHLFRLAKRISMLERENARRKNEIQELKQRIR